MANSFSLEDFSGPGDTAPPDVPKAGMSLEDFSPTDIPTDNSDQFLRSIEHGATFGLSEKTDARQTPEAIARFQKFKSEHPWLNLEGNVVGGGLLATGLPLVGAGIGAVAPEALTAGLSEMAAPVTGAMSRLAAPAVGAVKNATAGMENFINPLLAAGKSSIVGAGYGGLFGLGDSQPGSRVHDVAEGVKSGAETGPLAELGTEGVLGVGGGMRKLVEPFLSPMTTARRVFTGMFPGAEIPPIPAGVPGYKPTMGQATGNPNIQALERQALPGTVSPGSDNLATRLDEQRGAVQAAGASMVPNAQPGFAVNAVKSDVNDEIARYQQRAQDAAQKSSAALEGASGYSEHGLAGLTPQDASTTARAQLDGIQQYYRDQESAAWDNLDAPNLVVKAMGTFKNGVGDFYASLPSYAKGPNNPALESLYSTIKELPKDVSFDQIQQIRSDALKMARGLKMNSPYEASTLNDLADAIHTSVQDIDGLTPDSKQAWVDARAATKDRYDRFGNSLIGKYIGSDNAETAARAPSMTLQNILTGSGSADKFGAMLKAVTPEGGVPNAGVVNSVKQFIASDIADKLGSEVVNPKAVQTALIKYRPVINQSPELKAAFDKVSDAQDAAYAAKELAEQRTDIIQKSATGKFLGLGGSTGTDPGDPASIGNAVGRIIANPNPRQAALEVAGRMSTSPDAMNGMRRVLIDKMMDPSTTPHEFIGDNRSVLNVFFPDKEHQVMLDNIADASRATAASGATKSSPSGAWKDLTSDHNYLGALVGSGTATGAKIAGTAAGAGVGAAAAATGLAEHIPVLGEILGAAHGTGVDVLGGAAGAYGTRKLLNSIYNAPREKVVQLIKDGLLDPDGVGRKLTMPVSEINSKEVAKYIIPGTVGAFSPPSNKPGFKKGGKVSKAGESALAKSRRLTKNVQSSFPLSQAYH